MGATRRKACVPCAESKRRCDKQRPVCQRCIDREEDCSYPQPAKRRKLEDPEAITLGHANPLFLQDSLNVDKWDAAMRNGGFHVSIPHPDETVGHTPNNRRHWFLRDETWTLQHGHDEPACANVNELEPFIHAVEIMIQFWVRNGYNPLIHRKLYESGMPPCLQDAFTAFAAYTARTPVMADTVLQIADDRAHTLAKEPWPPSGSMHEKLALVHSLFVYVFMRLFDGSVRMRASAERQVPVLRKWVTQLWESVKEQACDAASTDAFEATSSMWRLWILTESARRTILVVDTVLNIFQIMTQGWAKCAGVPMVTARRGLWEANSPTDWATLAEDKGPLLVSPLRPLPVMEEHAAREIDEFAVLYWTFIVGAERIQSWSAE